MDLLLAAFPPELGPWHEAPPSGWRCGCTGIGAAVAAATTARLIAEERPARVLFVGTCGAYDAGLPIGSMITPSFVQAISLEEVRGEAYRPTLETTRWTPSFPTPFPAYAVLATPAITRSIQGAQDLTGLGAVEHLELGGVFAACELAGVAYGAALVVVNEVGPDANAQWRANHEQGSQSLIAALEASNYFLGE